MPPSSRINTLRARSNASAITAKFADLQPARARGQRRSAALSRPPSARSRAVGAQAHQGLGVAASFALADNTRVAIHHADARVFQRRVNSGMILHCRPSMIPGADLASWLRHHHPEGRPPEPPSLAAGPLPHLSSAWAIPDYCLSTDTRNQSADDIENQSTLMPVFCLEQASGSPSAKGPLGVSRAIGSYRPGS